MYLRVFVKKRLLCRLRYPLTLTRASSELTPRSVSLQKKSTCKSILNSKVYTCPDINTITAPASVLWSISKYDCRLAASRRRETARRQHKFQGRNSGLSLRAGGRGFPPTKVNVAPGYFHRKIQ